MLRCSYMTAPLDISELLASQSVQKLKAMDKNIDGQIDDLQHQKKLIWDALAKKGVPRPPARETSQRKEQKARGGRRTGSAAAIREIFSADPNRVWMPKEVIDALHARGVEAAPAAVRVALRRMGEKKFLVRGPDGEGWKLASNNGSQPESLLEANSSGPGGMGG
jgi:ribosomal protein L31E